MFLFNAYRASHMHCQCALPHGFDMLRRAASAVHIWSESRGFKLYLNSSRPLVLDLVLTDRSLRAPLASRPGRSHGYHVVAHACVTSFDAPAHFHCSAHSWLFFAGHPCGLCVCFLACTMLLRK